MVGTVSALSMIFNPDASGFSDGSLQCQSTGDSYALNHNCASATDIYNTSINVDVVTRRFTSNTTFYYLGFAFLSFNTSNLTSGATVTGVTLSTFGNNKDNGAGTPEYGIKGWFPDNPAIISKADYNNWIGGVEYSATRIPYASITASSWNNWTGNAAFIANVSKTGYTTVAIQDSWFMNNSFTGGGTVNYASSLYNFYTMKYTADITRRPVLTVTYTTGGGADTTPPASITGLTNITTCQNITWQWTNPTDIDFDVVQIYQDNIFLHNVTGNTDFWDPLSESVAYTFSSHTCDTTGNCNTTWVNLTSTTDTCPVPTTSPTTTATTVPPTTTTASPTPTPTPTPLEGCTYFNLTGVTFGENSTDWNATEGLNTWGVSTFNITQGNVSWWICRATPTTTAPPTWQPLINPSTDIKTDWLGLLWQWWWLPVLILIMILLFGRK
jgi:hypothetical protein